MTKIYAIILTSAHHNWYENNVYAYETRKQRDEEFKKMKKQFEEWVTENYSQCNVDLDDPITYSHLFCYKEDDSFYFYRDDCNCANEECWDLVEKHDITTINKGQMWTEKNDKIVYAKTNK